MTPLAQSQLNANVAMRNPRNIAPPSPMKIFRWLEVPRRKPVAAPTLPQPASTPQFGPFKNASNAKKNEAVAATPAHSPSMWSNMLNDAVIATTQKSSAPRPARTPRVRNKQFERLRMNSARKKNARRQGIPTKS